MAQKTIALLGQPNSGKSTLFNMLTGSHQHVGNWPGKTVEQKEGAFTHNGADYLVADLPGTYSLSANSDEEVVTRDYIAGGKADLVVLLADSAQLERSLYMLADFAGITTPVLLLLNMMDVAQAQGKTIDAAKLERALGIPVLPFVAADKKQYGAFYAALEASLQHPRSLNAASLEAIYRENLGEAYTRMLAQMPPQGIGQYSPLWLAVKCLENDPVVQAKVRDARRGQTLDLSHPAGTDLQAGDCKFQWIGQLTAAAAQGGKTGRTVLSRFDRLATSRLWGKPIALLIILLALVATMVIASPIMALASLIPAVFASPLSRLLTGIGAPQLLIELVCELGLNILYFALSMSGFVLGITFVFNFIEEVGYMARISFVFDNLMSKLGLQGKSIMAFFVGAGCTIGGASGTRVIDNWGQRVLAMALVWAVPCGATWALIPTLASVFFGRGAVLVMIGIVAFMFVFMGITAKLFAPRLAPASQRSGMIMEMPPYHKPRWGNLIRTTLSHAADIFLRALRVITVVALVFFLLSFSPNGDVTSSVIYKIGIAIEPVTRIFGLGWQTFMAFVASAVSKEAVLGVLSSLYANSGSVFASTIGAAAAADDLGTLLVANISKPEALAFIFAVTFNVPCVMALASTYRETHSLKWTARIAAYYTCAALLLSCLLYHIAALVW